MCVHVYTYAVCLWSCGSYLLPPKLRNDDEGGGGGDKEMMACVLGMRNVSYSSPITIIIVVLLLSVLLILWLHYYCLIISSASHSLDRFWKISDGATSCCAHHHQSKLYMLWWLQRHTQPHQHSLIPHRQASPPARVHHQSQSSHYSPFDSFINWLCSRRITADSYSSMMLIPRSLYIICYSSISSHRNKSYIYHLMHIYIYYLFSLFDIISIFSRRGGHLHCPFT